MNIHAAWDNDQQTVIRLLYRRGSWEWHDFYAALEQTREMLAGSDRQVGFIIDIGNASLTPGIFMSQSKILYEIKTHPAVSLTIVIGADRFIEALYAASMADVPVEDQFYFARTLEDAHTILETVNELPPVTRIQDMLRTGLGSANTEPQ
jgi:Na+/H+-dicarboxylate symporter